MRLEGCEVGGCSDRVPPGMTVCGVHADLLRNELAWLPELGRALEDAGIKAQRFSTARAPSHVVAASEESPVPFNSRALALSRRLLAEFTVAGDAIAKASGLHRPINAFETLGPWLADQVSWIRSQPEGGEMVGFLLALLAEGWAAVDAPPELLYLSGCSVCSAALYAERGALDVLCRSCGATFPVHELRRQLVARAEDRLLTASDMARAVTSLGTPVTPERIWKWAERGRLLKRGVSVRGGRTLPIYLVADVLDLIKGDEVRGRPARRVAPKLAGA